MATTARTPRSRTDFDFDKFEMKIRVSSASALKRIGALLEREIKTGMKKGGKTRMAYKRNPLEGLKRRIAAKQKNRKESLSSRMKKAKKSATAKAKAIALRSARKEAGKKAAENLWFSDHQITIAENKHLEAASKNAKGRNIYAVLYNRKTRKEVFKARKKRQKSFSKRRAKAVKKAKRAAKPGEYKSAASALFTAKRNQLLAAETSRRTVEKATIKAMRNIGYKTSRMVAVPSEPGSPPHVQTGNLRASVSWGVDETAKRPSLVVGAIARYGKIHEYGGKCEVKAYTRKVTKVWGVPLKKPRVANISAHTRTYPARPFVRPAFYRSKKKVLQELNGGMNK